MGIVCFVVYLMFRQWSGWDEGEFWGRVVYFTDSRREREGSKGVYGDSIPDGCWW